MTPDSGSAFVSPQPILAVDNVSKSYDGVRALEDVSFELRAGEIHALVGENGAGKSTLTKIITGAVQADSGSISVAGQIVGRNDPNVSRSLGIAAIYQQPSIFPHLSVAENIALSLEMGSNRRTVDWKSRHSQAESRIERLGASIDVRRLAGSLSMADQQIVEIAKAVGANAKILLMDEPTAVLTEREVERVFELIRRLKENGAGILYISHRLEEILSIADRITVLRDGHLVACTAASEVDRSELIQMMVGRSIASIYPKREVPIGDVALEVRSLNNQRESLHNISFSVRQGEIFGLAGMVGSGRTTLARTLFGLTSAPSDVYISGRLERVHSPADAIRNGVGYLPEDRKQHGVILEMEIDKNISLASLDSVSQWGLRQMRRASATSLAVMQTQCESKRHHSRCMPALSPAAIRQKVALARWLATKPRVLILDEPTQGVDIGSKSEIHELIMQLAARGMAIVLISSEMPEILGMCDRIGVFHAGKLAGILPRSEATQPRIMSLALGHG